MTEIVDSRDESDAHLQGEDQADGREDFLEDLDVKRLERLLLARGRRQQRAQLRAAGMLPPMEAAVFSGIPSRTLRRLRYEGKLLALSAQGVMRGVRYPAWQFENNVMPVLPGIVTAFGKHRMWQAHDFLTYPEPLLGGSVPLEEIRAGRVADVLRILPAVADMGHGGY